MTMKYFQIFTEKLYYGVAKGMSKSMDGHIPFAVLPMCFMFMMFMCNMGTIYFIILCYTKNVPHESVYIGTFILLIAQIQYIYASAKYKAIFEKYKDQHKQVMRFNYIYVIVSFVLFYAAFRLWLSYQT
jgi:uncharacterized membrane protein YidH (DUF202 family)